MSHQTAVTRDRKSRRLPRTAAGLAVAVVLPFLCAADGRHALPTFEERVAAQRAIEQVYWSHRIWPDENPGPKPALAAVLPDAAIRARVEDSLRKSNALRKYWSRPITAAQLQAELDRMAAQTQDGRMLQELFAALGNDPALIAETLARETLADRLVRDWYADDGRFHGGLKRQVTAAVAACPSVGCMSSWGGEYRETTWKLGSDRAGTISGVGSGGDVRLDAGDWSVLLARLAGEVGGEPESLPLLKMSGVEETPEAFVVTAVLSQGKNTVRTATAAWAKTSFDAWWQRERARVDDQVDAPAFAFTLPVAPLSGCTPGTWTQTNAHMPPAGRFLATTVWTGTEMIVWGGESTIINGTLANTGGRYNPATDTWTPTPWGLGQPVPDARMYHTAVWTGTQMIVWGGIATTAMNTGGRYDPSTDTWTATSTGTNVPAIRFQHVAVWTGTRMIVWGGSGDTSGGLYDPGNDSWTPTSTGANVPSARYGSTAVWTGSRMIVWGGSNDSSGGLYDPGTDTWTRTSTGANVPGPRADHTAVWTGTQMIVWGGGGTATVNTGGRYDPSTDTWAATSTALNVPAARRGHTAVWTGTEMIVWGGGFYDVNSSFVYVNTGGRYNPATNAWSPTSAVAPAPAARSDHAAAWTGSQMIVWGGSNGASLATGGLYDPGTDSWTPTSLGAGVPVPRYYHSAVWTGTEMIVWGGDDFQSGRLNSGGRYDPSTDTWRATSTGLNVPEGRVAHHAFWTGTSMIVWGGQNGTSTLVNTGGRYNPSADTWLPTSTGLNVPSLRSGESAVWTGTQMIVWGGTLVDCQSVCNGDCCYTSYNSGSRYNPAADAWSPTSTGVNVPTPRTAHSAVWTGTQMVVWGGDDGSGLVSLNTGGRYNPSLDTWSPTSTGINVPETRESQAAAWTGTQMIVWGGADASGLGGDLTSGGRYDPVADTWMPTSALPNLPGPRSSFVTAWTGTSLIVWGGYTVALDGSTVPLNTGDQYTPAADRWVPTSTGANVPEARAQTSAVWDGSGMIVWGGLVRFGGESFASTGGRYCPCVGNAAYYRDSDGDGYGDPAVIAASCDGTQPAGYVAVAGDCNDANAAIHPGAVELCNGLDDDCNGTLDDVVPPGAVGSVVLSGGATEVQWTPPVAAQNYDVVYGDLSQLNSNGGNFTTSIQGCAINNSPATSVGFNMNPPMGSGFWILVRGNNCAGAGTYDGEAGEVGTRDPEINASPRKCP